MTLIFRSDRIASNNIGNLNGIRGPQDFAGFLDFNSGDYLKRSVGGYSRLSLSDVVLLTRSTVGTYRNRQGVDITAAPNTPRIHHMPDVGLAGLLVEVNRANFIRKSYDPITQTVTINPLQQTAPGILWVEGSGSATVAGANIAPVPGASVPSPITASATEGSPLVFFPVSGSPTTQDVLITVSGSLTFAQLEVAVGGMNVATTKINNANEGQSFVRADDYARITDGFFGDVLNPDAFTIAVQSVQHPATPEMLLRDRSASPFAIYSDNGDGLTMAIGRGPSFDRTRVRGFFDGSEAFTDTLTGVGRVVTSVMGRSGATIKHAKNGIVNTRTTASSAWTPTRLELGSENSWIIDGQLNGIITRLAIYDRLLSDEELQNLSRSWM